MRLVRLDDLQNQVQKRADVVNFTAAFPLSDITELINLGWARVYGLLCETGENHYVTTVTFSTVGGQDTFYTTAATGVPAGTNLLPTDMYKVRGVDAQAIQAPAMWQPCQRYEFEQRNDYQPPPSSPMPIRLWYYPTPTTLVNVGDTLDGGNGWEVYAVDWAARRVAERDENYELCARLDIALAEMEARIKAEASNRNAGQAKKIRRVRHRGRRGYGLWGWPMIPMYDYQGSGANAALRFIWGCSYPYFGSFGL